MTAIPSSKLVTIFGASGFLGRHIVRALANEGWRVRAAVRYPNTAHFLKPMGRVGQIQLLKTNVNDDAAVDAALRGADAAINLVGVLSESGSQRFAALHTEAAGRIAELAAKHGVAALLHVSALGASADSPSHYARTKAEGEARVRAAFPGATIFRPSIVFGPEDDFFNRFAWLARLSPALPLIGGGHTRFQPVFVGDVAEAARAVLNDPAAAGKTYELGGPEIMTMKEVMQLVLKQTHRRRLLLPVPFALARVKAAILGLLPNPLLTLDQVRLLQQDNVVSAGALTLRDLSIVPTAAEAILPSYLWRFRKTGQFETVSP
ncbi:MAG TPA: complex I NDUFA9 subunit family protein [Micropepsaceae bacterium]|jgi:NADH dehydrogenase|nr:complex I NDUFA9 subunit family protein [Micropepsaceae bacterium]